MTGRIIKLLVAILTSLCIYNIDCIDAFTSTPFGMVRPTTSGVVNNISLLKHPPTTPLLTMTGASDELNPSTFREAEVLGLKLMQERKYKEALNGTRIQQYIVSFHCDNN
jgi:hypothetical protein